MTQPFGVRQVPLAFRHLTRVVESQNAPIERKSAGKPHTERNEEQRPTGSQFFLDFAPSPVYSPFFPGASGAYPMTDFFDPR